MTAGDRFVILGLAAARAEWFGRLARWSTSGSLAVEFVKCISVEELRARLAGARRYSAVLLDETLSSVDRDLLATVTDAGCPAIVVTGDPPRRVWRELGAADVLPSGFERGALAEVLRARCEPVDLPDRFGPPELADPGHGDGRLVAVCGPGGAGASSVAIALAQGLASDQVRPPVLVDLARRAEQAMLHGAPDPSGLQSLVERYRRGGDDPREVAARLWAVGERGYLLLPGLRSPRAWSTVRPLAFRAALAALVRHCGLVVCDTDSDLEGEREGGSIDVEERNVMARTAVEWADVVVAVGAPGMKGTHSLARLLDDLAEFGVDEQRIVIVVNRAPRNPLVRGDLAATLRCSRRGAGPADPVYLPERRQLETALRDGQRLPAAFVEPVTGRVSRLLGASAPRALASAPTPVRPGTLAHWGDATGAEAVSG